MLVLEFNALAQRYGSRRKPVRPRYEVGSQSEIGKALTQHTRKQSKYYHYNIELQGISTDSVVPFWMRANQYGSIPLPGNSFSALAGAWKSYDLKKKRWFDFGFSVQGRMNLGVRSEFILTEGFGKIRLFKIFEFRGGRSKEITGLIDSTLSTGAFAISGNALGVPKLQLSAPDFFYVPFTYNLIAVKGNFAHGWLGFKDVNFTGRESIITYFHQKSFYGRLGRPNWRLKLSGGFNHQVFWGSEKIIYGNKWTLSPTETFINVVTGKTTRLRNVEKSKVGNAMGSIDLGAEYSFNRLRFFAYRQFFYDVGALYYLANIKDGLTGLSITNTTRKRKPLTFNKAVFEFFYSKDQAGYPWSKTTPSGDEDYYNNYFYKQGWSYLGQGLGNPLITERRYARSSFPVDKADYFINNRIVALHFGLDMGFKSYSFILKATGSQNFGTFATSKYGTSLGKKFNKPVGQFRESEQYSFYLEARKTLKYNFYAGAAASFDHGSLLYNSYGFILKVGRSL